MIEAARQLSRFCDIYKSEFPGTLGRQSDDQLENNLHALDAASERPWVLLSAGVDYANTSEQVEMAMGVGASGILGGRAFWKEYFLQEGPRRGAGSPRPPGGNGWPRSMPWSARRELLGLPVMVSARQNWPPSGPPKAGTYGTARAIVPRWSQAVRRPLRARSIELVPEAAMHREWGRLTCP